MTHALRPALLAVCVCLALAPAMARPAHAQSQGELQRAEAQIRRAADDHGALAAKRGAVRAELNELQGELIDLALEIRSREQELSDMEAEYIRISDEEATQSAALKLEQERLVRVLSALTRVNRLPRAALLARPGDALDAAHAASIMGKLGPRMQEQVYILSEHLSDLTAIRMDLSDKRTALEAARNALADRRNQIEPQIEQRQKLDQQLDRQVALSQQQLDKLASEATSMRELLQKLEAERRARAMTDRVATALAARDEAITRIAAAEAEAARIAEERQKAAEAAAQKAAEAAEAAAREAMAAPDNRLAQVAVARLQSPAPASSPVSSPVSSRASVAVTVDPSPEAASSNRVEITVQSEDQPATDQPAPRRPAGIPAPSRVIPVPKGKLLRPVSGEILRGYHDKDRYGATQEGIALKGSNNALVLAPRGGVVEFAGDWGSYGKLLILAHGDEYHTVLGGLGVSFVTNGQAFVAGEPLGRLPVNQNSTPELYFEVRRKGAPLDPTEMLHDVAR